MREHSRIILGVRRDLGDGDVLGSPYEFPELPVRHGIAVHPETVHRDTVRRSFFGIMLVRSHAESATGYPDHPVGLRSTDRDVSLECGCREKRCHLARCLPIDRQNCDPARGTLRRSPVTGYWTVVQHRSDPASVTGADLAAPARMDCAAANIGPLFLSDGKFSVDFAHKSWAAEAGIRPQKRAMVASRQRSAAAGKLRNL